MEATRKGDWILCKCVFVPPELTIEEWDAKTIEEKERDALWTAYRFRISELRDYCRSDYKAATFIYFKDSTGKNVDISISKMDELINGG